MKPFDPHLSLQLDKATVALEQAQARQDTVRERFARRWKRELENYIFEERQNDTTHPPR